MKSITGLLKLAMFPEDRARVERRIARHGPFQMPGPLLYRYFGVYVKILGIVPTLHPKEQWVAITFSPRGRKPELIVPRRTLKLDVDVWKQVGRRLVKLK